MSLELKPRILLVEDDVDLCKGWTEIFELFDFEHVFFHRGLKALADKAAIKHANILISDYYLPDLNGVDLVKRVREINPEIAAIVLTGSRELSVVNDVKQLPHCSLLHKPLNIDTLESEILSVLKAKELRAGN